MALTDYFPCPACGAKSAPKHEVNFAHKVQRFYGCTACRHHFQVLFLEGQLPVIVAESPREVSGPKASPLVEAAKRGEIYNMGCPSCNRYGPIKMTYPLRDGEKWRRHKCVTCGPYFSCEEADGVSVHRRMKSKLALEI
jgi:transcription elongation factor Elf1